MGVSTEEARDNNDGAAARASLSRSEFYRSAAAEYRRRLDRQREEVIESINAMVRITAGNCLPELAHGSDSVLAAVEW